MTANIPNVFTMYPSAVDAASIRAMFDAQQQVFTDATIQLRKRIMSARECFDLVATPELLASLTQFGDLTDIILREVIDHVFPAPIDAPERETTINTNEQMYPYTELGFSVPAYYLSFFFDDVTSIGFAQVGPMPTSLEKDATNSITELIILNDATVTEGIHGVLIGKAGEWV